jgi:hypothetical protein
MDTCNVVSAAEGSVLVHRILQYLAHSRDDDSEPNIDAHVTIFFGHDSTLDSMATALDIEWELPWPFLSTTA